jgi:hypothetical protein
MTDTNFLIETAQLLFDSDEEYPVNFDFAWQWLGYSKPSELYLIIKNGFKENIDFIDSFNVPKIASYFFPSYLEDYLNVPFNLDYLQCPKEKFFISKTDEIVICQLLAKGLKGLTEVSCTKGRVDIVTDTQIIEVKKRFVYFNDAIKQINRYSECFPEKQKVIFICCEKRNLQKNQQQQLEKNNITLFFLNDFEALILDEASKQIPQKQEWLDGNMYLSSDLFLRLIYLSKNEKCINIVTDAINSLNNRWFLSKQLPGN